MLKLSQADQKNNQVTKETVEEFLFGNNVKLSEQQKSLFIATATRFNLDPFKHEIYAISYGNRFNIVIGYEAYIKRAELSGKLNGWNVKTNFDDRNNILSATATIYRKDWANPLVITVYKKEYEKDTPIWKSMPATMCEKIAISRAFKLAFPLDADDLPESVTDENAIVVNGTVNIAEVDDSQNNANNTNGLLNDSEINNLIESFGVSKEIADKELTDNISNKNTDDSVADGNNTADADNQTIQAKRVAAIEKANQLKISPDDFKKALMKHYNKDKLTDLVELELEDLISKLESKLSSKTRTGAVA